MSPASIIVVGFVAADPDIVVRMAADCRLPTIATLHDEGARAETACSSR